MLVRKCQIFQRRQCLQAVESQLPSNRGIFALDGWFLTFKYNMRRTEYIICIQLICLNKTEQHMNLIQKINTMGAGRKFCLQQEERSIKKELSVTDVKNKHMDTKWERGRMN